MPSGEAQARAEAPLNDRAAKRVSLLEPVWRDCFAFMLSLVGYSGVPLAPQFAPIGSLPPEAEANLIKTYTDAGMPLASALRMAGVDEPTIAQVVEERQREAALRRASIGEMYGDAQAQFDRMMTQE